MCLETKTIKKEEELLQYNQTYMISPDLLRTISEGFCFSSSFLFFFSFCVEEMSKICKGIF